MQSKKPLQITLLFFLVLSLVIQSCASYDPPIALTLTIAPLDFTHCPPVTPIPSPITEKPKVIYVLIDRSGSFGLLTKPAIDILIDGLILAIEPGDRLNLIWLGENEDSDKNWLVATVPEISLPSLPPPISTLTPTFVPTSTSIPSEPPTPNTTSAVLEQQESNITATAQAGYWTVTANASSVIATNAAIQLGKDFNQQQCSQTIVNNQNIKLIQDWQAQRAAIAKDFVDNMLVPLKNNIGIGNDNATHIYNSLYYAARTIRQEKDTDIFGSYYLIILSDMEDFGSLGGTSLEVDLTDVNVLMAMVYCKDSIACQNRSDYWVSYFIDHHAILPTYPFRLVDETTHYVISDFLK